MTRCSPSCCFTGDQRFTYSEGLQHEGRTRAGPAQPCAEQLNAALYCEQLAELERDVLLGLIGPAEAERTRDELHRRLLEDISGAVGASGASRGRGAALGVAVLLPVAAVVLCLALGTQRQARRSTPARPSCADTAPRPASVLQHAAGLQRLEDHAGQVGQLSGGVVAAGSGRAP